MKELVVQKCNVSRRGRLHFTESPATAQVQGLTEIIQKHQ